MRLRHTVESVRLGLGITALALALALAGCDSGGGDASGTDGPSATSGDGIGDPGGSGDPGAGAGAGEGAAAGGGEDLTEAEGPAPWAPGAECAFDEALAGKDLGDQLENVSLLTYQGDRYDLHQNCGQPGRKVVWVFFVTEWCGACESYAHIVQEYYDEFADDGLEIMWIMGEDANENPVTAEWCEKFVQQKGLTYTVLTDYKYYQAQKSFPYGGGALPHQYIVDATNMELVFERGGVGDDAEQVVFDMLGVTWPPE